MLKTAASVEGLICPDYNTFIPELHLTHNGLRLQPILTRRSALILLALLQSELRRTEDQAPEHLIATVELVDA